MSVSQTPTTIFTRTNSAGPDITALTQLSAAKPEFGFDEVMAQQRERKNTERDSDVKAQDRAERTKRESKPKESAEVPVKQEASEPGNTPDTAVESKAVAADELVNDQPTEEPLEAEGKDKESQEGEAESEPSAEDAVAVLDDAELEPEEGVLADGTALTPLENQGSQAQAALVGAEGALEEAVADERGLAEEKSNSPARPETLVDPTITSEPVGSESGTVAEALTASAAAASQAATVKAPGRAERPVEVSTSSAAKVAEPAVVMMPSATVAEPVVADSPSGFSTTNRGFGTPSANPSTFAQAAENSDNTNAATFGELKASLSSDGAADNKAQVDPKNPQAPSKSAAGLTLDLASTLTSSDTARQAAALTEGATTSSSTAIEGPRIAASTLSQFQTGSVRGAQAQVSVQTPVGQQPQWGSAVAEKVLWMAAQNLKSAEIHLNPAELGPMMVKITVSQDQVSVTFSSQQVAVREALDQTAFRLREQFDEQGLNLVDVDVSDQGFGQEASDDQGENGQGGSQASGAEGSEDERTVPVGKEVGLVDYFV